MVPALIIIAAQGWCPWCGDHMGWGWGGGFMMFFWLAVLLVIALVLWRALTRSMPGAGPTDEGRDRAEAILRERYARGEIDEPTFRRMLDELTRK